MLSLLFVVLSSWTVSGKKQSTYQYLHDVHTRKASNIIVLFIIDSILFILLRLCVCLCDCCCMSVCTQVLHVCVSACVRSQQLMMHGYILYMAKQDYKPVLHSIVFTLLVVIHTIKMRLVY